MRVHDSTTMHAKEVSQILLQFLVDSEGINIALYFLLKSPERAYCCIM